MNTPSSPILSTTLLNKLKWRRRFVMLGLALAAVSLVARAVQLQVVDKDFYVGQGDARQQRTVPISAHRGMIVDRNGEPMAMSTPVDSVWANPAIALRIQRYFVEAAALVGADVGVLQTRLAAAAKGDKIHLARGLDLSVAQQAKKVPVYGGVVLRETQSGVDVLFKKPVKLFEALQREKQGFEILAEITQTTQQLLRKKLATANADKLKFVYLKRHLPPQVADRLKPFRLSGVGAQREYRRYYPMGEVVSHVLGFTNIDDKGQEGLELAFEDHLNGEVGAKRVMRSLLGETINDIELIRPAKPGQDLALSIDRRVQYLAYRALKSAMARHKAKSGSVVTLDAQTGEVLAMVNQPGFNPNNRKGLRGSLYRNRAITDVFEPGSTMKPITIAAALDSGSYQPHTLVNTGNGRLQVGDDLVKDVKSYGWLDVAGVIKKSSNVGVSKIALSMQPEYHWGVLNDFGFGQSTGSGFPGETPGYMHNYYSWSEFEQATVSFGYGLSVSALQLAQAYAVLANDGQSVPTSFQKGGVNIPGQPVVSAKTAQQVRQMMRAVVSAEGTAPKAKVAGYTVAGKTGTVHKNSKRGGYEETRYVSLFAGIAPATQPRLVTVVMVNEPKGDYFGGQVAAPVFSQVMGGALRLLNVMPDDLPGNRVIAASPAHEARS